MNFVKYLRALFYRTPPEAASSQSTLKKIKNILSIFSLPRFAFHNRKLSQEMCFILHVYYAGLCTGRSKKERTVMFFGRAL